MCIHRWLCIKGGTVTRGDNAQADIFVFSEAWCYRVVWGMSMQMGVLKMAQCDIYRYIYTDG